MGHPEIVNDTPFALEVTELSDEHGQGLIVPIVKATFDIRQQGLELSSEQRPVTFSGEHWGDPDLTPYKLEPETAFCKPDTDLVLVGTAHFGRGVTQSEVSFQVGDSVQRLRVTGDRAWHRSGVGIRATPPRAIDRLPLSYEFAYGGWDRTHADVAQHHCHEPNPSGRGYRAKGATFRDGSPLPNIEAFGCTLDAYDGPCQTVGFGFTGHHWQPRRQLGGTYDAAWQRDRSPLLPRDFDRRFFNAASAGLVRRGRLRGDEPLMVRGARDAAISARLPGVAAPVCQILRRGAGMTTLSTELDTVIVDIDAMQVLLLWRGALPAPEGMQGIRELRLRCDDAPKPKAPRIRLVSASGSV